MNDNLIKLEDFLLELFKKEAGNFNIDSPTLGVAGESRLGVQAASFLVGRTLSQNEFKAYEQAARFLGHHAAASQQLIEITRQNYDEYVATISRLGNEYEEDHVVDGQK